MSSATATTVRSTSIVHDTLEEAIKSWERLVRTEHPLFEMPVERFDGKGKIDQVGSGALWGFATDKKKVLAHLYQPEQLDLLFKEVVLKMYETAYSGKLTGRKGFLPQIFGDKVKEEEFQRTLSFHNGFSLLIHELFHPLYCPNSEGYPEGDKERIYQALAEGIQKALPQTSAADLVAKVHNIENAIWDFCIDTFQYNFLSQNRSLAPALARELQKSGYQIDSQMVDSFPEGVIPIFDVVSYAKDRAIPSGVLALNRYTYSLLFCKDLETRKKMLRYFEQKLVAGGIPNIEQLVTSSLKGLVKEVSADVLRDKSIDPARFSAEVESVHAHGFDHHYDNTHLIEAMTSLLLDKVTRYDALKGFIQPLAHLIRVNNYERRGKGSGSASGNGSGQGSGQGSGSGSGTGGGTGSGGQQGGISGVVQALLSGMAPQQGHNFLEQLAGGAGSSNNPHLQQLQLIGQDEYYKRNSPEIRIESTDPEAKIVDQGKIKIWVKDRSLRVTADQLHRHLPWINFGIEHQLPVLLELAPNKLYVVNYFHQEETTLQSHDYQSRGIDVARNWVLIEDSSGTMGGGPPGCGSRFDAVQHINYGLTKSLIAASEKTQKEVDIWTVNFSGNTHLAGPLSLPMFYDTVDNPVKKNMLNYQGGGTTLNTYCVPKISAGLKPGRTVWSFLTDGDISNADDVYQTITELTRRPETCVLFFEINYRSKLGERLRALSQTRPNLRYQSIDNLKDILQGSMDVLVQYK
ncbi:MAG: hypothetical protein AABX04_02345 [Nanoarchaeota archaeon]